MKKITEFQAVIGMYFAQLLVVLILVMLWKCFIVNVKSKRFFNCVLDNVVLSTELKIN